MSSFAMFGATLLVAFRILGLFMTIMSTLPTIRSNLGLRYAPSSSTTEPSRSLMLVPTLDTVRYSFVMQLLSDVNRGALLIGESGTGKTAVVLDFLNKCAASGSVVPFVIAMSAQTSSTQTQEMIELRLEKKRKGVFGAPSGKKLVCFVHDANTLVLHSVVPVVPVGVGRI